MGFNRRHIAWVCTLFAGLIILAHALVPHHHHHHHPQEVGCTPPLEKSCACAAHDKGGQSEDADACILKVLIPGKTRDLSLHPSFSDFPVFGLEAISAMEVIAEVNVTVLLFPGHRPPLIKQFLSTTQSLRAPPSF